MLTKIRVSSCCIVAIASVCAAGTLLSLTAQQISSDGTIRQLLASRVDTIAGRDDGIGIVVGTISPAGRKIISYGHSNRSTAKSLAGNSIFEIGSVGKVFTALLLSEMVQRGEVALNDPVSKYLPEGTKIPAHDGRQITLADLATHTSGLPFMPDTYPMIGNPDTYGSRDVYNFLARYQLKSDPGTDWEYSNVDYWLLGQALSHRAGMKYDELLEQRVFRPLKLNGTFSTLPERLKPQVAQGHDASLQPALPFYSLSVYSTMGAAAGGVYSSVNDLLDVLSVALGIDNSPLGPSMDAMLRIRRTIDGSTAQALGWVIEAKGNDEYVFHDGGTWGYASAVGWDPKKKIGIVVLSNQQDSVADIARHLLRSELPLEPPKTGRHTEIRIPAAELEGYAGRYALEGVGVFQITREGGSLTLLAPVDWGLPKFRLHPESKDEFFVSEMPMHVTFQTGDKGNVTGALIYPPRGQHGIPTTKIKTQP